MEIKTILCPVDGTELADKVLEAAAYLGKALDARVVLLNIVEKWYRSAPFTTDSAEWETIHEGWLKEGRAILETNAGKLKAMGVKHIETTLGDGEAAYEIVAIATQKNADLIVMATHRYSPMGKLFIGSVTSKVSKHTPCPIMWVFAG
ncbi:MAG: universal stress protein [Deltaproteobacteria bacterium]|nr:universal stress protein [Deltaproteobacteria bacterium]